MQHRRAPQVYVCCYLLFCKACFSHSDRTCAGKIPASIGGQKVGNLWLVHGQADQELQELLGCCELCCRRIRSELAQHPVDVLHGCNQWARLLNEALLSLPVSRKGGLGSKTRPQTRWHGK